MRVLPGAGIRQPYHLVPIDPDPDSGDYDPDEDEEEDEDDGEEDEEDDDDGETWYVGARPPECTQL